jgi:hypothetical protein
MFEVVWQVSESEWQRAAMMDPAVSGKSTADYDFEIFFDSLFGFVELRASDKSFFAEALALPGRDAQQVVDNTRVVLAARGIHLPDDSAGMVMVLPMTSLAVQLASILSDGSLFNPTSESGSVEFAEYDLRLSFSMEVDAVVIACNQGRKTVRVPKDEFVAGIQNFLREFTRSLETKASSILKNWEPAKTLAPYSGAS